MLLTAKEIIDRVKKHPLKCENTCTGHRLGLKSKVF